MSTSSNIFKTADLYDFYEEKLKVCEPIFYSYGGLGACPRTGILFKVEAFT